MIKVNNKSVDIEHFPDGTQKLSIKGIDKSSGNFLIDWRYEKEEELSTLIYITKSLRNKPYSKSISLKMYYLPNARMDRTQEQDEVFTLRIFAEVINWLNFESVEILDVHSNVGIALINNAIIKTPKIYIDEVIRKLIQMMILI